MASEATLPEPTLPADSPYAERASRDDALRLAIWIFLASEALLFAGLFAAYAAYRLRYPLAFAQGVQKNEEWIGSTNTLILLVSSFFVAWAVHSIAQGRTRASLASLLSAVTLGGAFLGLKALEYSHHLAAGIAPVPYYHPHELTAAGAPLFATLYYMTTGLHALHVIAGITILLWLAARVARGTTSARSHIELELGGLYWHFVDIVWIFLWPLLYLIK
jgi:cytochrome c oxidase subunit 3